MGGLSVLSVAVLQLAFLHLSEALQPPPVTYPAYFTTYNYPTNNVSFDLYVQGGSQTIDGSALTAGFYSLSMGQPFNANNPPWIARSLTAESTPVDPPKTWKHAMAMSPHDYLAIWVGETRTFYTYLHLYNGNWVGSTQLPDSSLIKYPYGHQILMDRYTQPYIPYGCTSGGIQMTCKIINYLSNVTMSALPWSSAQTPVAISYYTFTGCTSRESMLLYGGIGIFAPTASPYLYEYISNKNTWTHLTTTGTSPGDVNSHCMLETSDRTKMIAFGGISSTNTISAGLFILNLKNMNWTQGTSAPASQARYGHTCTTNGDSFLVWGGQNATSVMGGDMMIYHIPTNQWISQYVIKGPLPASAIIPIVTTTTTISQPTITNTVATPGATKEPSTGPPPPPEKKSSIGPIAGGVIGGLIVILAIGFFIFKRNQRNPNRDQKHKDKPKRESNDQDDVNDHDVGQYIRRDKVDPNLRQEATAKYASSRTNDDASSVRPARSPPPLLTIPTPQRKSAQVTNSPDGNLSYVPPPPPRFSSGSVPTTTSAAGQYAAYSETSRDSDRSSALSPHTTPLYAGIGTHSPLAAFNPNLDTFAQPKIPQSPHTNPHLYQGSFSSFASPGSQGTTSLVFNNINTPPRSAPGTKTNVAGWGNDGNVVNNEWELQKRSNHATTPPALPMTHSWMMANTVGSPHEGLGNAGPYFPLPPLQPDRFRPMSATSGPVSPPLAQDRFRPSSAISGPVSSTFQQSDRFRSLSAISAPVVVAQPEPDRFHPMTGLSGPVTYSDVSAYTPTSTYSPTRTLTSSWSPNTSEVSSSKHASEVALNSSTTVESAELRAKRLALKKAQLEFDLEKLRVEEAQTQRQEQEQEQQLQQHQQQQYF
ncbi:hypothetical protein BGZ83_011686 [Gryganskiella cystojenkinii]|nr:hypothetical protein BGZ83_011686 [Gryganskiella cystojenkinii]